MWLSGVRMNLALLCFCLLHLTFASGRIFSRSDLQTGRGNLPEKSEKEGPLNQGRQRSLFARRGQYERQRIYAMRPKAIPAPPKPKPPTTEGPKLAVPTCSQSTQSCHPQSGCCDACATCHCHFFNAICFCRRINSQCKKKT